MGKWSNLPAEINLSNLPAEINLSNLPAEINWSNLPEEMISEILCRLPTELVLECKLVCKPWKNVVHHPSFSQLHLLHLNDHNPGKLSFVFKRSRGLNKPNQLNFFEYSEITEMNDDEQIPLNKFIKINISPLFQSYYVSGSSHGLICVSGFDADFYICNPVTKEFLILPGVKKLKISDRFLTGFGYLPLSNEYKVVKILELGEGPNVEHAVEVYTLGSGIGWRHLGIYKLDVCIYNICQYNGFFANGILHWVTEDRYIVASDLADEKFCEIPPLPIPHDYESCPLFSLGVLGGYLYCAKREIPVDTDDEMPVETDEISVETSDIWVLKKNKGNFKVKDSEEHQQWSWSKEFNGINFEPLALMKNSAVLFRNGTGLFSYDVNSSCSKMLVNYDEPIYPAIPYIKTLVSLKALGEKETKTMDQRE